MCGIVTYFGGSGGSLTRVITGMSSIIYRAPDSTGLGLFGDDQEPIRARKAVGSITRLIETITADRAYPNRVAEVMGLCSAPSEAGREGQRRILAAEGFSPREYEPFIKWRDYPIYDLLLNSGMDPWVRLGPGRPGRIEPLPAFPVRGRDALRDLIVELINEFDLAPAACQALMRRALADGLAAIRYDPGAIPIDILNTFDEVFENIFWEEVLASPDFPDQPAQISDPRAWKAMWRVFRDTPLVIPEDYDRDGVCCLLRLLDSALLSRLTHRPAMAEEIEKILTAAWPENVVRPPVAWRDLYRAEKGVNVFGRAASAGLAYLQKKDFLGSPDLSLAEKQKWSKMVKPGWTDPFTLEYLAQPVIAHGRWALQAAVNERNAHPFFDLGRQRAVVLNGQFSGDVEADLKKYLQIAQFPFRSDNSTEYLALLWGHYFDVLSQEQKHSELVSSQIEAGLENFYVGSQSIDFKVFHRLRYKSLVKLDEMAFLLAARQMTAKGGQLAVAALSVVSPRRIYIACHNRPAFVVRRVGGDEVMVVSDINAALGLFPQSMLLTGRKEITDLENKRKAEIGKLKAAGKGPEATAACLNEFKAREESALVDFLVDVIPLEGEEIFAHISTVIDKDRVTRIVEVADFNGNPKPDLESFTTILSPVQTRKEVFKSFYETHLREIPGLLNIILRTYLPDGNGKPALVLKENRLKRRFGHKYTSLRRIVLVGIGSSYHIGRMAGGLFQKLLPNKEIVIIKPVEVERIQSVINPDRDLVVLMSWSGTSADMVQLAQDLKKLSVLTIGLTEKPFSDMALITRRSGGVISILSGEEVTYAAIKSTVCMLLCAQILALWLAAKTARQKAAGKYARRLLKLPKLVEKVLSDQSLEEKARKLARNGQGHRLALIFDDLMGAGTGLEAAAKIEECTWSMLGRPVDYRDFLSTVLTGESGRDLINVNASSQVRLPEALKIMKMLYLTGRPFTAVSYDHRDRRQIEYYSRNQAVFLPKADDVLQPVIDLAWNYQLAYHLGLAHGRIPVGFPRNRAKSVTTSRSRPEKIPSAAEELLSLTRQVRFLPPGPREKPAGKTVWEKQALFPWERKYYKSIRRLTDMTGRPGALSALAEPRQADPERLAEAVFGEAAEDAEIVMICLDRPALAAAAGAAAIWGRLIKGLMRVVRFREPLEYFSEDAVLFFLAANPPDGFELDQTSPKTGPPALYIGPEPGGVRKKNEAFTLGRHYLRTDLPEAGGDLLYAAVNLVLAEAFKIKQPDKAGIIEEIFMASSQVVDSVLNDARLRQSAWQAMEDNLAYQTARVVGPPEGPGPAWVDRFDRAGSPAVNHHLYGEAGHGPIATVDPDPEAKYVRLEARSEMTALYGIKNVENWEDRFLPGRDIDSFLSDPETITDRPGPFSLDSQWYLPVLKPGYQADDDTLIMLDASRERHLDNALDSLGTYGPRFARLLLITQAAFVDPPFQHYPIGHYLYLPAVAAANGPRPIPEPLTPLALNLLGAALAAARARLSGRKPCLFNEKDIISRSFGRLGQGLLKYGLGLDQLDHGSIAGLKNLAPLVSEVRGGCRYEVRKIEDELDLMSLAEKNLLLAPQEAVTNLEVYRNNKQNFYLVHPEKESFTGLANAVAERDYAQDYWIKWAEAYGAAWRALYNNRLVSSETDSPQREPWLALPVMTGNDKPGWLYYIYVKYFEWNHEELLADQLALSVAALGGETDSPDYLESRYVKISSLFNQEMAFDGVTWSDWLLALLPRSWPLGKGSKTTAPLLAERVRRLLVEVDPEEYPELLDKMGRRLEKIWPDLTRAENRDEDARFEIIGSALREPR